MAMTMWEKLANGVVEARCTDYLEWYIESTTLDMVVYYCVVEKGIHAAWKGALNYKQTETLHGWSVYHIFRSR